METNKKRYYPKENLLNTWKYLHVNGYFDKHKLYDMNKVYKPPMISKEDIKDKIIVEIGCGYGRHTAWFSQYAKKVYAIEVSDNILEKAILFTAQKGNIKKIDFVLAENYKKEIPNNIDVVYCYLVFQHLHEKETQDYITTFYYKLKETGKFIGQFLEGKNKSYCIRKEPKVMYTEEQLYNFFKLYPSTLMYTKIIKSKVFHYYVIGEKI